MENATERLITLELAYAGDDMMLWPLNKPKRQIKFTDLKRLLPDAALTTYLEANNEPWISIDTCTEEDWDTIIEIAEGKRSLYTASPKLIEIYDKQAPAELRVRKLTSHYVHQCDSDQQH